MCTKDYETAATHTQAENIASSKHASAINTAGLIFRPGLEMRLAYVVK